MQWVASSAVLCVFAAGALAQAPGDRFSLGDRLRFHAERVAGPGALFTAAAGAGIGQWRDEPSEWGQGGTGYGRRIGNHAAANALKQAISFGAGAALREDPRYFRSGRKGFWPRARSAIERTFLVPGQDGGEGVAYSRLVGAYGAGFLSNTWYPGRGGNPGEAVLRGSIMLGGDVGGNFFREFWPDIKNRVFGKR